MNLLHHHFLLHLVQTPTASILSPLVFLELSSKEARQYQLRPWSLRSIMVLKYAALLSLGATLAVSAQESGETITEVSIPVPIADGTPPEPAPEPDPIDFTVLTSRTKRMDVVEAPPMSGLPPVTGTINVTMQLVADPGLPAPPPPLPPLPPDDPAVLAAIDEFQRNHKGREVLFVSATVYDHSRTFLRIYPNGVAEREISAWSNIDFSHFGGFSTFRVTQADGSFTDHGMIMGLGNTNTHWMAEFFAEHGHEYAPPPIPKMADPSVAGPDYLVVDGDADDKAGSLLKHLHDLYRREGARMEDAYHAREQARKEREAFFRANPPTPKDVTISFWKRDGGTQSEPIGQEDSE